MTHGAYNVKSCIHIFISYSLIEKSVLANSPPQYETQQSYLNQSSIAGNEFAGRRVECPHDGQLTEEQREIVPNKLNDEDRKI
jgi:hypothetical protein